MGAGVRPEQDLASLIAERRKALASSQGGNDLSSLIAARRQAIQMAPSDATAQTQGPVHGDLAGRVIGGVLNTATQLVTHPIQSAESMVAAPVRSFTDAVIAPSVGEARPDPRLSKGGNSAGKPLGGTYDAEHGAVTGKQRVEGAVQTLANVTAPAVARGVTAGARAVGVGKGLANAAGVSAIGATTGAAYSPGDPLAGGMTGAIMAPALVGLLKVPGKLGGAVLDRTAIRPATTPEVVPEPAPIARNDPATAARALRAGSDPSLADPANRAVLERPGFIRMSNRPGTGGVIQTGPFIQGEQPRGTVDFGRGGTVSDHTPVTLRALAERTKKGPVRDFLSEVAYASEHGGKGMSLQDLIAGIEEDDFARDNVYSPETLQQARQLIAQTRPKSARMGMVDFGIRRPGGSWEQAQMLDRVGVKPTPEAPFQPTSLVEGQPPRLGNPAAGYLPPMGATRLFDPLTRMAPEIQGFDTRARAAILRALEDKGLTPDDAKAELQRRIAAGEKPETIMELAGRPGARLGRTMRAASPKAGDVIDTQLEQRALGAPQRVIDDALETSGLKQRSSGFQTTQQLIDQRAKDATTGYGETFQDETPINDERITKILSTPAGKRAWKRAVTMMKNDGVKVPEGKQNTEVEIPGGKGLASATVKVPMDVPTPTIQQLHYLKLALDDMARPGMDRGAGQGGLGFNEARSISGVKGKLLEVMDEASPSYKAAREQYAETSALKDANELGRSLWKGGKSPEQAAHEYAQLGSDAEREVFRRAGMDALADRLENGPEDVAKGAKKPRDLARIRLLFPDDATFQQFKDRIAREAEMQQTYGTASKGSQTADKLNDLAGMMDMPVSKLTPRRIVNAALTARGKLSSRRIAEAGAPMLTATGSDLSALLDQLARDYQTGKAGGARRTAITRAFATGVGSTSGRRP